MRILSITAGAANMFCGSCLRDNALARELIGRGHDVTLQPVYTPTLTDEENVSSDRVLFGALTISTLKGERGFQRKEIDKLVAWLREEPPYDVINLPNALLIGLAEPIKRATGRPVLVTLQGENLFLDGLPPGDRDRALAL